jgi:hypothetical protein
MELGKIIDDNSDDDNMNNTSNNNHSNKNGEALSKGGILEKVIKFYPIRFVHLCMYFKQILGL